MDEKKGIHFDWHLIHPINEQRRALLLYAHQLTYAWAWVFVCHEYILIRALQGVSFSFRCFTMREVSLLDMEENVAGRE